MSSTRPLPPLAPLVVGVDGSPPSDAALRYACRYAVARGMPLTVLHSWQPYPAYASGAMMSPGPLTPTPVEMADAGQRVLDAAAMIAAEVGARLVHTEVLAEGPAPAALMTASEEAQLVIIGGRDGAQHEAGWLGPVPLRLAAKAHCPVVVVPNDAQLTGDVVVGFDGSDSAGATLDFAFDQAAGRGCDLTVVFSFAEGAGLAGLDVSIFADRRESARRQLSEAVSGWGEKYPDVVVRRLVTDEPALRALRTAAATASLVVVGSHGRGFFLRHVLGSVSSALLRVSDCPVAVVRPDTGEREMMG